MSVYANVGSPLGRPSPALVLSFVALFVSLSGGALALSKGQVKPRHIATDAVRSKHIKDSQVKAPDLRDGAVNSAKLVDGAVTTAKLANGPYWRLGGNGGTNPAAHFLGTTDNLPLNLRVNNLRALRLEPALLGSTPVPNVIAGFPGNSVTTGVGSATISGGGGSNPLDPESSANRVTASWGTVGGGGQNAARGRFATVPGGALNIASGDFSFAAGLSAHATPDGSFVWADSNLPVFGTGVRNRFAARATGGFRFVTGIDESGDATSGVQVVSGSSSWSTVSDRRSKENLQPADGLRVLRRLASIPISTWNWRSQGEGIRHIGPMAQDFRCAFGVGEDARHISTVDADGVALAAIQGLNRKLVRRLRAQRERIRALERLVTPLTRALRARERPK